MRQVAAFREAWKRDGYGPWAVVERAMGRLVGHLGLRRLPERGETELLFLIGPDAQGRGYATEGGRAARACGFGRLALPGNAASIAVLERLGMTRGAGLVRAFGVEVLRFGIEARGFQRTGAAAGSALPSGGSSQ